MRIYFVRHGESVLNVLRSHQSSEDALTDRGRSQAEFVAKRFKEIDIDVIISSDYVRARETSAIISQMINKEVVFTELARERRTPTEFHGKRIDDPSIQAAHQLIRENSHDPDYHYADEENFNDIKNRARKLLEYLESRPEENLLVVLHGGILRYLILMVIPGANLEPSDFRKLYDAFWLDNAGITVCEQHDNKWKLMTWNDRAHLGEGE